MKSIGFSVICSDCGKKLRGSYGATKGIHIRKHKRPDGTVCRGHWWTNHRPAEPQRVTS